jgi:beclin 1
MPSLVSSRIDKDKIGGQSIKYGDDETWTRALKYLLTNLKWLIVWTAEFDDKLTSADSNDFVVPTHVVL